jgi:hypothetical protein
MCRDSTESTAFENRPCDLPILHNRLVLWVEAIFSALSVIADKENIWKIPHAQSFISKPGRSAQLYGVGLCDRETCLETKLCNNSTLGFLVVPLFLRTNEVFIYMSTD